MMLADRVAIVTGAGNGIGKATALALARAGAHVVAADIDGAAATETVARAEAEGGAALAVVGDVAVEADVERMIALGIRVRLVKGAYAEPPSVAFPRKQDVDLNFQRLAERLLRRGTYPAIATHDERLIDAAKDAAAAGGIAPDRFEFQMLYGIRRDLQARLRREGYRVRVYVPFGEEWYPYFMRRLAERPANVKFVLSSVLRERGGR